MPAVLLGMLVAGLPAKLGRVASWRNADGHSSTRGVAVRSAALGGLGAAACAVLARQPYLAASRASIAG